MLRYGHLTRPQYGILNERHREVNLREVALRTQRGSETRLGLGLDSASDAVIKHKGPSNSREGKTTRKQNTSDS
jgi:hypothetical protein